MRSLADLFYEKAAQYPDKTAIWCDNESITYKNLANMVSRYSNFLLENGVKYGDHIGTPMNNSIISVAIILAAANLGVGIVPINPSLPINAVKTAFLSANVKHLIARKVFFEQCEKYGGLNLSGVSICMDGDFKDTTTLQDANKSSGSRPIVENLDGNENLIITMTSGSTGQPKPISLTQNNKYQRAKAHIKLYGLTREDRVLAATPLYHSLAERLVIMPLILGATSILLPRFTPNLWLNCVKEQKVTFTIAVSAQLGQIADSFSYSNEIGIDSLRCVVSSSALLEPHVKDKLINNLQCDFHEMYGTSEVSTVTNINFKESAHKQKSVGRPLPEAEILILNENDQECTVGEIGEIACRTKLVCNGYYGKPELFKTSSYLDFFKTGDMGYVDEDGYLYFVGRKKDIIITGGVNVYPQDIERCVMELPEISECAAFAYPDERLGEIVALTVVLNERAELSHRTIQIQCARNLADFQQPHKIFFINGLPKNAMGKLVRSDLLNLVIDNEFFKGE